MISTFALDQLLARDLSSSCRVVFDFVRQDRLRARYLREVARHLRLEADAGPYHLYSASLARLERNLLSLRSRAEGAFPEDPEEFSAWWQAVHGELANVVMRHRVTTRALWTSCDFLGLQLASSAVYLEKDLRRSLESAQKLIAAYGEAATLTGSRLLGFELPSRSSPSVIVSFNHLMSPQVDFRSGEEDDPSASLCIFVELPYWYAVRHRHLSTVAHEVAYAWLNAVALAEDGAGHLRELLGATARAMGDVVMRFAVDLELASGHEFARETAELGHAYACKLLADLIAYSVAGPAYLNSFFVLNSGFLQPRTTVNYAFLPMETRLACLLRVHHADMAQVGSPWADEFRPIASGIEAWLERFRGAQRELGLDDVVAYHSALAAAATPLCDLVSRRAGDTWRLQPCADHGGVAASLFPNAWDEVERLLRTSGKSADATAAAAWRGLFEESSRQVAIIPNFLWGQYLHRKRSGVSPTPTMMGRLAQPLWDAMLRPSSDGRVVQRGEYFQIRFYRMAPGTEDQVVRTALRNTVARESNGSAPVIGRSGLLLAGVVGSWDLLSMWPGYSSNLGQDFPPIVDRAPYVSESHVAAELQWDGDGRTWVERLTAHDRTFVVSQFVLGNDVPLAQFVTALRRVVTAGNGHGVSVEMVLASLGWEDVLVFWGLGRDGDFDVVSQIVESLHSSPSGGPLARHSFTQVLVAPEFVPPHETDSPPRRTTTPQAANFAATLEVEFSGVPDVPRLAAEVRRLVPGVSPERESVPWGHVDLVVHWPIVAASDLSRVRQAIASFITQRLAVSATCNWLPSRSSEGGKIVDPAGNFRYPPAQ